MKITVCLASTLFNVFFHADSESDNIFGLAKIDFNFLTFDFIPINLKRKKVALNDSHVKLIDVWSKNTIKL